MVTVSAGVVATSPKCPPMLSSGNQVPSGKIIAAVGQATPGTHGGGLGVGNCAEPTETMAQLRLIRNASLTRDERRLKEKWDLVFMRNLRLPIHILAVEGSETH
jgi:hypothetical protein